READAILFVTPEYNYSVSGVLKNAIDWASRPYGDSAWNGKPAAIMGASPGAMGTARAQYHLRQMLVFLNMFPINQPEVMIAHALGEHMGRYAELAETLVEGEFVVYGNDHRGHGLTAKPSGSFGEFGPGGFDQLVEDMISLRVIAKNEHPRKPYILLGHSLGSFAAQQFVLDHSHSIDGLALSGSGILDGLARLAESLPAGEDPMKLMNAAFEPARTPFDWLSRDNVEVDAFINDPLCFP